jgi:hypothetical protein
VRTPTSRSRAWADPPTLVAVALWACCLFAVLLLGLVRLPATPDGASATGGGAIATTSVAAPCLVGQVKGSSSGLYHEPDGRWYAQTRRATCFDTVAEARAAGYLAAGTPR